MPSTVSQFLDQFFFNDFFHVFNNFFSESDQLKICRKYPHLFEKIYFETKKNVLNEFPPINLNALNCETILVFFFCSSIFFAF